MNRNLHCADVRFAHPGDVAEWMPATFDEYLVAQDADRHAASRTLTARTVRAGWATLEVILAAYASLAVLVLVGANALGSGADWCADKLCTATDHTTARLARLGRPRPNRLLRSMYDPEQPGRILPHEDPDEDDAATWFRHWENEVAYSDAAEARAADAEAKLAAAEAALGLLYTVANLGAVRARQRDQFLTGTVRTGKSFPLGLLLCQACGHPARDDDPLGRTPDGYTIHATHTEHPDSGFYLSPLTALDGAGTPGARTTAPKEITS